MKIYIDLIFLINFFFDFVILYGTKLILKKQIKIKKIFIGALIGGMSIVFLFTTVTTISLFLMKIGISILMVLVTFGKDHFLKNYLYFYMISIFLGGVLYLLNIQWSYQHKGFIFFHNGLSINLIMILLLTPIIIYLYVKEHLSYKNQYSNYYHVDIFIGNKKYQLSGYLDTGNTLKDPYRGRSVILLNLEKNKIYYQSNKMIYVPYQTITTTGVIPCIKPDKVIIKGKEFKNLLIGDIKQEFNLDTTNCILPNQIKEDLICIE